MSEDEVAAVFAGLPMRFRALLSLVDPSAESGPETFMRLILRALGVSFHTQVYIDGVGRVDFVVEGWLIVECDSRGFHEGWDKQVEDRRRDMAAAKRGYVTIRPLAADILRPESGLGAEILAIRDALRPRSRR
jgi:very-short-patch-repair endonuclease